jgi:hypothetical protein
VSVIVDEAASDPSVLPVANAVSSAKVRMSLSITSG